MTILSAQGRRRLVTVGTLLGLGLWLEGWIGVLLLAIAADLAVSRRLFGARPIYWPGLGVTAAGLALVVGRFVTSVARAVQAAAIRGR
jgi:vacuolar-type H+-ATPase subunit I/STV1